ncbi:hypothetical protein [Paracoccus onubensis]|uniref:Uncharacterized protein n=1 Tax=Paracoccus onubensis TaxID=1675788 RepID=A0A418ST13_9RHOB|nr:hypothetical protein [Paracoccus onubensis]RJE84007.1 hypothetical protein D3P04_13395 [Paracoccus onubensis]
MNATKSMPDPFVTRHLGHITYQGPESEAPNWSLPIDLPACDDLNTSAPVHVFDAFYDDMANADPSYRLAWRDLIYVVFGAVGTAIGGLIALWMLK